MIISDTYAIFWREMKRYRKSKKWCYNSINSTRNMDCSYGKYLCWNSTINTISWI